MSTSNKLRFKTLEWADNYLRILDQTRLPEETVYLDCDTVDKIATAIKDLKVRGAPAIGIAAAFGVVVGMRSQSFQSWKEYEERLSHVISTLAGTRPTAVNLFWALERMRNVAEKNKSEDLERVSQLLLNEAISIHEEDRLMCEKIGEFGASLLKDGDTVLTHCNAGALATGGIGTALGIIYTAEEEGKRVKVYVDETRPLLQGARLTAWELMQEGIETVLICDNMAGDLMRQGIIDKVIVGADRVAANGDVANKIGTYTLAVLAKENEIPFYVACPFSSIDLSLPNGEAIPIEQRDASEIREVLGKRVAPEGVDVYNPAFDVTPARYIAGIITERGICKPPYEESLKEE